MCVWDRGLSVEYSANWVMDENNKTIITEKEAAEQNDLFNVSSFESSRITEWSLVYTEQSSQGKISIYS